MKGLLIKDFRLLKGQVYFLLIVTVCVIVFMINGSEAFGVAYVCSMVALLSLTTVSYDEYENGSAFLFTLPITKNCVSYNSVIGCCVRNIDAGIHERNKVCTECKAYIESDG